MSKTDCIRKILSFHSGIITKSLTCNGCNLVIHSPLVTARLKEPELTAGSPRNCDHLPPCHCRVLTVFLNWMIRFNTSTSNQCRWISPRLSRLLPKVTSASSLFTAVAIRHWKSDAMGVIRAHPADQMLGWPEGGRVILTKAVESLRPVPMGQRSGRDDTRHCLHFGGPRVGDCQFAADGHIADEVKLVAHVERVGLEFVVRAQR